MKRRVIFLLLILIILLSGCGTSKIITDSQYATIYINGKRSGTGDAEITRTGFPQKMKIEVRYKGSMVACKIVKRKFTFVTFIIGYLTYGIGFITAWQYPETIMIPVDVKDSGKWTKSSWDNPHNNNWEKSLLK
jgi:hypothetical protein